MVIYSIILFLIIFGIINYDFRKNSFLGNFYYFLVFAVMTIMTGMRYRVGGDSLQYDDYFKYFPTLAELQDFVANDKSFSYQPLYLLFVALCKTVSADYYFYQMVHSVVVNAVIFWFVRKNSDFKYTVLLFLYIFLFYFYFTFEIQREIFAICCFLLGFEFFKKSKWIPYYALAVTAFFFHISAIILFALPLFKLIKFNRKFIVLTIIFTLPLIFLKGPLYSLLEVFFVSEAIQNKGETYSKLDFSIVGILSYYFVRVIIILPFLLLAAKYKMKNDWLLAAFLVLSISSQIMVGFDRFLNYLYIPYIIFAVDCIVVKLRELPISLLKRNFVVLAILLNLFFVINYKIVLDMNITNRARYQAVFFPYGSTLDKEKNVERENFIRELWDRQ